MSEFEKSPDKEWIRQRLRGVAFCIMFVFMIITFRLMYIQIIQGMKYRLKSEKNAIRLRSIVAPRGLILDRNKKILADNRAWFNAKMEREDRKDVTKILEKLARKTNLSFKELKANMDKARKGLIYAPVLIKTNISREQLAVIEANKLDFPGVRVDVEPVRYYPYKKIASHLLGYLGEINKKELESKKYVGIKAGDFIGRSGVEKVFDKYLQGVRGGRQIEVDANGRTIKVLKIVEAVAGNDVTLALDFDLQLTAQKLLENKVGSIVAVDPSNGDVLVMASTPDFNQNDFIGGISSKKWNVLMSDPDKPMLNRAIQAEYPPASTYKILIALTALQEKKMDVYSQDFCPGFIKFNNRVYRCWQKNGHQHVNIIDAIEQSCDVFFYNSGIALNVDRIAKYAKNSGFGKRTGIILENEKIGLIPTSAWKKQKYNQGWQEGETLSIAIGQGYSLVTPLQMAVFTSAIANGGTLYRPRVVKFVKDTNDNIIKENKTEIIGNLPFSKENLEIVKKGLVNVVHGEKGTARKIRQKDIMIAGKTGTAQVFSVKREEQRKTEDLDYALRDHAWFVCYAPAKNPVIAISVIVEHGEHGSTTAAPIAEVMVKKYWKILKNKNKF